MSGRPLPWPGGLSSPKLGFEHGLDTTVPVPVLGCGFEHGALGLLVWFRGARGSAERQALLVHELDVCHGHVSVEIHAYGVECLVDPSFQIVVHANGNIAHLNHLP